MKITEAKMERVCDLRYNNVKVIAIAVNERLSEKTVRTILKQNYPTYVKIRERIQLGYTPWGNSPLKGKPVTEMERRDDGGYASQDVHCSVLEHQGLIEKINEQEKTINAYKENDRTKDLQLQQKNDALDGACMEIERLNGKNAEYEGVIQEKDQQINDLKERGLSEFQALRKDFSELKTTINNNNTTFLEKIEILTKTHRQLNLSFQTHNTTTLEKIKLEQELQTLKEKHNNDLLKYGGVAVIGFSAGMLVNHFFPSLLDSFVTGIKEQIKNTNARYTDTPIPQPGIIQPYIHNIYSGVTLGINTSGILCSGIFSHKNVETYGTGYDAVPNPPDDMNQANIQGTNSDITTSINISGTTQSSGIDRNNHIETMELRTTFQMPQATSHYVPHPAMIPVYFSYHFTPIPNDLVQPYGWIPIKKMDWTQSTPFICWLFEQLGYKILWVKKSHDKGGDILLERFGEILVIQVKHRKENTGIDALKEALFGKKIYNATKAMVISFGSPFTRDAPKDAEKAEIELLDLEQIIAVMRKHNIYYPIE
ncbi:MAG: restriction endonuclease [Candidatus Thermoplasmatota archaeon]